MTQHSFENFNSLGVSAWRMALKRGVGWVGSLSVLSSGAVWAQPEPAVDSIVVPTTESSSASSPDSQATRKVPSSSASATPPSKLTTPGFSQEATTEASSASSSNTEAPSDYTSGSKTRIQATPRSAPEAAAESKSDSQATRKVSSSSTTASQTPTPTSSSAEATTDTPSTSSSVLEPVAPANSDSVPTSDATTQTNPAPKVTIEAPTTQTAEPRASTTPKTTAPEKIKFNVHGASTASTEAPSTEVEVNTPSVESSPSQAQPTVNPETVKTPEAGRNGYRRGASGSYQKPNSVELRERSTGCQTTVQNGRLTSGTCSVDIEQSPTTATGSSSQHPRVSTEKTPTAAPTAETGPVQKETSQEQHQSISALLEKAANYNRGLREIERSSKGDKALLFPLSIPARISSAMGWRIHPISRTLRLHTGTDFAAPRGTPVRAADSGRVSSAGKNGGYGKLVSLRHDQGSTESRYAHLSKILVEAGDRVEQGTVIGLVGSTGNSTGPHLHFEWRRQTNSGWAVADAGSYLKEIRGEAMPARLASNPRHAQPIGDKVVSVQLPGQNWISSAFEVSLLESVAGDSFSIQQVKLPSKATSTLQFPSLSIPAVITSLFNWQVPQIASTSQAHPGTNAAWQEAIPAADSEVSGYSLSASSGGKKGNPESPYAPLVKRQGEWLKEGIATKLATNLESSDTDFQFEWSYLTNSDWVTVDLDVPLKDAKETFMGYSRATQAHSDWEG